MRLSIIAQTLPTEGLVELQGPWERHGLPGLIIFALITAIVTVVWYCLKHIREKDEKVDKFFNTLTASHTNERSEWRSTVESQQKDILAAFHANKEVVSTLSQQLERVVIKLSDRRND